MKRFFVFILLAFIVLATSSTVFALPHGENNPAIFKDMKSNPSNYILTGAVGMGLIYYMDKSSIKVDKYAPPEYIIAFRLVTHKTPENYTCDADDRLTRYRYDYKSRRMYREIISRENGESRWEYIDPSVASNPNVKSATLKLIAEGELAFYLAYNMSFYDKPVTYVLKEYIAKN